MRIHPKMTAFLSHSKSTLGADACWPYPGPLSSTGYAHYKEDGRETSAHRESYRTTLGNPEGLCVCHHCDNRRCVNPTHLFLGTPADNHADAMAKDRHSRGERNGASKLTAGQVLAIREDARRQTAIASEYGISQAEVSEIKLRHHWRHLQ